MDFTAYYADRGLIGKTEGNEQAPAADFYLLDGAYTVLGAYTCGEGAPLGSHFFDRFPANRPAKEELREYLASFPHEVLLLRCGRVPIFFVGTFFAHTGLVFAIIPRDTLKQIFAFPAAFHHVPATLFVSKTGQMYYKAHAEADFAAACRFYTEMSAPFLYHDQNKEPSLPALFYRAVHLAQLCGVRMTYDFSGLRMAAGEVLDPEFCTGLLLGVMMAARRLDARREVHVYGAYEGAPVLFLQFCGGDGKPHELFPLLSRAEARGRTLDVVRPQNTPDLIQVRAVLTVAPLSVQGVRERQRFLTGGSPLALLPKSHAVPLEFPELSLN